MAAASTSLRKRRSRSGVFPPSTKSSSAAAACSKSSDIEDQQEGGDDDDEEKINLRKRKICSGTRCDDAIAIGTDHGSSSKKIKSMQKGTTTTTGDWAIYEAFNRCFEQSQAEGSAASDNDAVNHLGLSLIEAHVLKVACSRGLPVHTNVRLEFTFYSKSLTNQKGRRQGTDKEDGGKKSNDDGDDQFLYSWSDFGSSLVQAAKDWYNLQLTRNNSAASSGDFHNNKDLRAGYGAVKLAVALADTPEKLAQRTIMLMEKVRQLSMSRENNICAANRAVAGVAVETWFSQDLKRWASALGVANEQVEGQPPVAYSAADFVSECPVQEDNDNIKAVCLFDAKAAHGVVTQVAHLTRLRSLFLKFSTFFCDVDTSVQNVLITWAFSTSRRNRESDVRVWKNGPVFWGSKVGQFHDDVLLLRRLLINGYLGVLENGCGFSFSSGVTQEQVSMRSFGLTRRALQERAQQLTVILAHSDPTHQGH